MTSLPAVFGFLAAVLYEGHSLSCETCLGHGSASCQGSMKKCDKVDDLCIQGYENNTLGSDTRLTVVRACQHTREMPPFVCEASDHSVRNSEFYLGFVTTCGQDRDELEVPPINLTSNGYKCPDCMKEDTIEECKTEKVIKCVGRQTQCFSYRGKTSRPGLDMVSYSCKGCATPHFCSLLHLLPGTRVDFPSSQCNCTPAS